MNSVMFSAFFDELEKIAAGVFQLPATVGHAARELAGALGSKKIQMARGLTSQGLHPQAAKAFQSGQKLKGLSQTGPRMGTAPIKPVMPPPPPAPTIPSTGQWA